MMRAPAVTGWTLIEALATVAVLSLVATTLVASGMVGDHDRARSVHSVVASIRKLDETARMTARTGRPVALVVETSGRAIGLRVDGRIMDKVLLGEERLGEALMVVRLERDAALRQIRYDGSGVCADYRVLVRQGTVEHRFEVAGDTGWWRREHGAEEGK